MVRVSRITADPIDICPLGSHLQHYWDRLSGREKRMEFNEEGLFSLALESVALDIAEKTPGKTVADAFCGAGGMAIGFARVGKKVVAIDNNQKRLGMAERNASLFGVGSTIDFLLGDTEDLLPTLNPDAVFLDPPWGGTDYNEKGKFNFSDFESDGAKLIELAFSVCDWVVMRVPKNFDLPELESIGREYEMEKNMFKGLLLHYCVYFRS